MHLLRSHPRLTALAAALLACLVVVAVAAVRSRQEGGCASPAPLPQLPAQLRSLGNFDQPYDATQPRSLQDAALEAAAALHPNLAAATSLGAPLEIAAVDPSRPAAIVFPLGTNPGANGLPRSIAALAVFLRSCGDQAYFSTVDDLSPSPPAAFPGVSQDRAERLLGVTTPPDLVYTASPLQPRWQDRRTGASVPAT